MFSLTAAFERTRQGWVAEVLEARNVYTQGRTLSETRDNLAEVIRLLLEDTPPSDLFGHRRRRQVTGPGTTTERLYFIV
jgi:predicted RNase H-like HicB family nuclease